MSTELRIDLSELNRLWVDLLNVSATFGDIQYADDRLRTAVGDDHHFAGQHELAKRIHEFNANWDDRRKGIVESLDTIWHALQSVETTFHQVDGALASALEN